MIKKSLHILFSFLLLVSFSWQCAAKTIIYFSFTSNQKKIAATLCINKKKPKSCCAGKCYLNKELKKEDNRQSNSSTINKDKIEKFELKTGVITFIFDYYTFIQAYNTKILQRIPTINLSSVFHPPAL